MSEQKPRQFKLRNGAIVEENFSAKGIVELNGFIDEYIFVTAHSDFRYSWKIGEPINLVVNVEGFPVGGVYRTNDVGPSDYDIIEEIFPEEQS